MGQKNIGVREEVHAAVEALKQPGESFSDVLLRLVAEHKERMRDWRRLVGLLSADEGAAVKDEIRAHRRTGFDREPAGSRRAKDRARRRERRPAGGSQ